MAKHRTHSLELKRQVAQEFLAGETLHGLAKRIAALERLVSKQALELEFVKRA